MSGPGPTLARASRATRYGLLLALLGALLLVGPPLAGTVWVAAVVYPGVLAVAALAVGDESRVRRPILALAVAAIAGDLVLHVLHPVALVVVARSAYALFVAAVGGVLVRRLLRERRADVESILGGICAYLLLGLFFASLYGILEFTRPGSFTSNGAPLSEHGAALGTMGRFPELLYFSFVTLTTLGYGDLAPARDFSRVLSAFEALTGQIYLAVFIASLVGLHIAERRERAPRSTGRG